MNTKEQVLQMLEAQRGTYLSGEQLAQRLAVSRNAVWKAIRDLRSAGHQIDAATNRGYCIPADADTLSLAGMLPYLAPEIVPGRIQVFPTLPSTNQTAKELALSGAPHGTAVIAAEQTGGRGRYARRFVSPEGGLYLSVILHPERLQFAHITAVTAFAAVAVCEAIEQVTGLSPRIKWVNDLFLGDRKVCGILTEAVTDIESGSLGWIVLGIGINVNTRTADFPPELREIAGALYPDGAPVRGSRCRLAAEILNRTAGLQAPPQERDVMAAYRARLMMLGQTVTVHEGERSYQALAVDLDDAGHLILQSPDGTRRTLSAGEISLSLAHK